MGRGRGGGGRRGEREGSNCSPYVSSSAMSVEDEKMGYKEDEMSNPSHLTLHQSISTEELDEMGDVDIMITDLQALQQEFGVNP